MNKILDLTKLKVLADDIVQVTQMMIVVFNMVENIVGTGKEHILLLPQWFLKASLSGSLKVGIVW